MNKKKIINILLLFTIIITQVFSGALVLKVEAKEDPIEGIKVGTTRTELEPGDKFDVIFKVKNKRNSEVTLTTVEVVDNPSFIIENDSKSQEINQTISPDGVSEIITYKVVCDDTDSKRLQFLIGYKDSDGSIEYVRYSDYVSYKSDEEMDGRSTGDSSDTLDKEPKVRIKTEGTIKADAGDEITIALKVENTNTYNARNIVIKPEYDEVFSVAEYGKTKEEISAIRGNKEDRVTFKVKIDEKAQVKTYPLKFKISWVNAGGEKFEREDDVFIKVENIKYDAKLTVKEVNFETEGKQIAVKIKFENNGTLVAKDVVIALKENENFIVSDNITEKFFDEIESMGEKEIEFDIVPKEKLKAGTYSLGISTNFKNIKGETITKDQIIYLPYKTSNNDKEDAKLLIKNVKMPSEINYSDKFEINFELENEGQEMADDVVVNVETDEGIVPFSLSKVSIDKINSGEMVPVKFILMATDKAETKNYSIKLGLNYKKNEYEEEAETAEQYVGVYVNGKENGGKGLQPKVIISNYSTNPDMVRAGENYTLNIEVKNTNMEKSVKNMKVTLIVTEGTKDAVTVFTPVKSSTYYIDELGKGKVHIESIDMYTIPDAQPKNYPIKVLCEYEYLTPEGYVEGTSENLMGINVIQPTRLEAADVVVGDEVIINEEASINVDFFNRGKVEIQNLMVTTEGDFRVDAGSYYVGNFEAGNSDYYEATIIAEKEGEAKGKVLFSYEDSAGKEHVLEQEFVINAMPAMEMGEFPGDEGEFPGMDKGQENLPEKKSKKVIFIVIGVVAVVGVVSVIVIRKKIKKKKGLTYNEDI